MDVPANHGLAAARLRCGLVLRVRDDACQIFGAGQVRSAGYAPSFPAERTRRLSPGHLVALATTPSGSEVVTWRWYDAVVLGEENGQVMMWEPAHGEVAAQPRHGQQLRLPGTRAYLSAGLPGADWWVAGAVAVRAEDADVELDEVERFYDEHDLWNNLA
jgi:hypothetical protein